MTTAPVLHALLWNHPQATSRRRQPTWCGEMVDPREIAKTAAAVTCDACHRARDAYDALDLATLSPHV